MDPVVAGESPLHYVANPWVQVDGEDDVDIVVACDNGFQRIANRLQRLAERLTPMDRGEEDAALPPRDGIQGGGGEEVPRPHHLDRVYHGIPSDIDVAFGNPFRYQICARRIGRGEMQRGRAGRNASVDFFREGAGEVKGAEPRLDVPHGNALIKCRKRGRRHRGGVALDQHEGGLDRKKGVDQRRQGARGEDAQVLPVLHQSKVDVRHDAEDVEGLMEHFPVLRGGDHNRLEVRHGAKRRVHRRHLNGFRAGADDETDAMRSSRLEHGGRESGSRNAMAGPQRGARSGLREGRVLRREVTPRGERVTCWWPLPLAAVGRGLKG